MSARLRIFIYFLKHSLFLVGNFDSFGKIQYQKLMSLTDQVVAVTFKRNLVFSKSICLCIRLKLETFLL